MKLKQDMNYINTLIDKNKGHIRRSFNLSEEASKQLDWLYYDSRKRNDPQSYGQIISEALNILFNEWQSLT